MELVGRETRSILDRYNITNSQRKVAAVEKLTGAFDAKPSKKVAGIRQWPRKWQRNSEGNGGSVWESNPPNGF
jgi:hypothetical protein